MKEILIKNVTILTMDDENSRFFGWVLLKNGKIDALGEGEPPACSEVLDGEADREIPEGLGLGLTICRGIADSHGATLRFEARPEGGVRATVEIDAAGPAGEDTEGRKTMKVNEQGEDA